MIAAGSKVRLGGERQRYTVQAADDNFAICTKPFNARKTYIYSIVDLQRGVRGPCNLIFGPPRELNIHAGAAETLAELQSGELAVSYRRFAHLSDEDIAALETK